MVNKATVGPAQPTPRWQFIHPQECVMLIDLLRKCMLRRIRPIRPSGRLIRRDWRLMQLEERAIPAVLGIGYVTGSGPGAVTNQINIYDTTGVLRFSFNAFFNDAAQTQPFLGGANVALADVNGDGVPDVIAGAGPGGSPIVKVYDGATLQAATDPSDPAGQATAQLAVSLPLRTFNAFPTAPGAPIMTGGVNVAGGDIDGNGQGDIATAPGSGWGSNVKVFNYNTLATEYDYFAYDPSLACGATVAMGNVGGDIGTPPPAGRIVPSDELITGAGLGGGPHVKIYSISLTTPNQLDLLGQFYAFDANYFGGITVAVGNITNNIDSTLPNTDPAFGVPFDDIVVGAGLGHTPEVKVFRLSDGRNPVAGFQFNYVIAADYLAYDAGFLGGVRVAATANLTNNPIDAPNGVVGSNPNGVGDILTTPGPGGGPDLRLWNGKALNDLETYTPTMFAGFETYAYPANFIGGVSVG
jgi:hypothetical protein